MSLNAFLSVQLVSGGLVQSDACRQERANSSARDYLCDLRVGGTIMTTNLKSNHTDIVCSANGTKERNKRIFLNSYIEIRNILAAMLGKGNT